MAWSTQYVSQDVLKNWLRISTGSTEDDAEIDFVREAASRSVDQFCNRSFGLVATSTEGRIYTPYWDRRRGRWVIDTHDFATTSSVTINIDDDDDQDFTDYAISSTAVRLYPFNSVDVGRPYERIIVNPDSTGQPVSGEGTVEVKARWGWGTSVPDAVVNATLLTAARYWSRRFSPFGVAGSPDIGSELRLLAKLDVDAQMILQPYVKHWGAV